MQHAKPTDPGYHRELLTLLARLHFQGITHNDLAKEPNLLVLPNGSPAILDLQLGRAVRKRGAWFRLLAREDLRHLLKHKRTYCPDFLTAREQRILATPSWPARAWRKTGKRVYMFVTRRLLKWQDREGAGDRGGLS
jgi:serine/threonine protein kinase